MGFARFCPKRVGDAALAPTVHSGAAMTRTYNALPLAVFTALVTTAGRAAAADEAPPAAAPVCPVGCEAKAPREGFGAGGVSVGVGFLSLGNLNDRMTALGYEKLSTTPIVLSGHGRGSIGNFIIGGRGGAFVSANADGPEAGLKANYTVGWGGAEVGYALVNAGPISVTPVAILGAYGMTLFITDDVKRSLADTIGTPTRNTQLSQGGALLGVSVPVDVRIALKADEEGDRAGLVIGLEPTFLYGIQVGEFASGDADVNDAPRVGLTGGYLALSIGGGTW